MADLHEELATLRVDWPETPDLAAVVTARLEAPEPARRMRPAWRPALAYGVAIAAAALAVVLAASPDARSSVLEWLGLKSVRIERREPTVRPRPPGKLGARLGLGTPVTLAQAGRGGRSPSCPAHRGSARRTPSISAGPASRWSTGAAPVTPAWPRLAPRCSCRSCALGSRR